MSKKASALSNEPLILTDERNRAIGTAGKEAVHRAGLLLQHVGGRRILLDQRRVLLRHLVHLVQRLVDLLDPR